MGYYDENELYAFMKGKGKNKGKYKNSNYVEDLYYMKGKGYGGGSKGKGKTKSKNKGNVNAYSMDYDDSSGYYYVLDFKDELYDLQAASKAAAPADDLASMVQKPTSTPRGMLDSGATCSAGPETSIKNLIGSLMQQDKSAKITVNSKKRPKFRFGSGTWGRALYQVTLESSLSKLHFCAYALPDPAETNEDWFNESMLVPVLVGMDFVDSHGLIVDFNDGVAVCANHEDSKPFILPRNTKRHLMVDVVNFLTDGKQCLDGSPEIHVTLDDGETDLLPVELHTLTCHNWWMCDLLPLTLESEDDRDLSMELCPSSLTSPSPWFCQLWERRLRLNRESGLMGSLTTKPSDSSTSSPSAAHGAQEDHDRDRARLRASGGSRSPRSKSQASPMALSESTSTGKAPKQQVGNVDKLQRVRFSPAVCAQEGSSSLGDPSAESGNGEACSGGTSSTSTRRRSSQRDAGQGRHRQGDCRRKNDHTPEGVPNPIGEGQEEGGEGETGNDFQEPWTRQLRGRRLSQATDDTTTVPGKLGSNFCSNFSTTSRCRALGCDDHGGAPGSLESTSKPQQRDANSSVRQRAGTGLHCGAVNYEIEDENLGDTENMHPLPLRVGQAMVNTMHHIHDEFNDLLAETVYGNKPVIWEVFCSPNSELSKQCSQNGMCAVRINLANGFDLYKDDSWNRLYGLYEVQKPKKAWFSPKCTFFCDWVDLNYKHRPEVLAKYLRRERRMLRNMIKFLYFLASKNVEIYWEWPWRCKGWKERIVLEFKEYFKEIFGELWECRIDGCRFGLKDSDGEFLKKSWRILTSSQEFYNRFRLKCCVGNHQHGWVQGSETAKSAYYPVQMCQSIARCWRSLLLPARWTRMLWQAPIQGADPFAAVLFNHEERYTEAEGWLHPAEARHPGEELPDWLKSDDESQGHLPDSDLPGEALGPRALQDDDDYKDVTEKEIKHWQVQLSRFHRAAGHPALRNLARMLSDAQVAKWKVKEALKFRCQVCQEHAPGGRSSKQIPPASLRPLPKAWEHLGIDVSEWEVPNMNLKLKFILMMDMATHYKVTEVVASYKHNSRFTETSDDVIKILVTRWFMDKPRPKVIIPDNAKTLISQKVVDFFADIGVAIMPPPERESWAHGVVERSIGLIKETASKIHKASPDQNPIFSLALATSAANSTEFQKGYTPLQWAFGHHATIGDEELRQQLSLPLERQQDEFMRLLSQRSVAEDAARKAKATVVLSKLKNTSIRQPIRQFSMAQPVMIWRKFLPHTLFKGRKGGKRLTYRPRWVGPGRVVFHELIAGQDEDDRKQIVWVVLGNILYRCSIHSVRPLSEREQALFEAHGDESHRWQQLTDMIPRRNYVDIEGEEPKEDEVEGPFLPALPGNDTLIPPAVRVRLNSKLSVDPRGLPFPAVQGPARPPQFTGDAVNKYDDDDADYSPTSPAETGDEGAADPKEPGDRPSSSLRRSSTTSKTPLLDAPAPPTNDDGEDEPTLVDDSTPLEPDYKKMKTGDDEKDDGDDLYLDLNQAILDTNKGYIFELELDWSSTRQKKLFMRDPSLYLAKKINSSEVSYRNLSEEDRKLFDNAKASEVSSFIRTAAVRRCLSAEEAQRARESERVLRARWVLVWKSIPAESKAEALAERKEKPESAVHPSGDKKAKARVVVLGFEHPDLVSSTFKSSAPVQSQLMRCLSLTLTAQKGWTLEGLDMSTAFLQTGSEEMEQEELYTSGVPELKKALGASQDELLRLMKNIYGNATAPRGLWKDVDRTFTRLGGHRIIGDSSFWVWTQPNPNPRNEADRNMVIGYVGGHVDDFNRSGDLENPEWLRVRKEIDAAYKWGTMKQQAFRHTGIDLEVMEKNGDRWIQLSQDFYVENLQDLAISADRLRQDPKDPLSPGEVAACRAALGALQWCATQTQLHACSRVNLLLTELTVNKTLQVAKEIQALIKEIRDNPVTLRLWRLPEVEHWQDMVIVTLADQAHANRPQGGSTGGYITFLGGPQIAQGEAGRMSIVAWRTWKLRRKAISTNDGEIQSMVEGEDANFRTRFLWCQLNGCLCDQDLLQDANRMVSYVKGIIGTDSRGGFDAINKNEGPLLGLSNVRSALQAFQLREQLQESKGILIWISGDWNLGDALTKKDKSARAGILQFFKNWIWKLTYDPNFIQSEKKAKRSGQSAVTQMRQLQSLVPWTSLDFLDFPD